MPSSAKPLPAIPLFPTLSTLSVDSRPHLERIIHHSLSDSSALSEDSRSTWQSALLSALDELGDSLSQGSWLEGVKKRRTSRNDGYQPESSTAHTLERLSVLISQPPTANSPKHLLLCVAPLGSRLFSPSEDSAQPSNISCTFAPNLFPIADLNSGQGTVLYGLQEWTGI